jgi:hypothetical protein
VLGEIDVAPTGVKKIFRPSAISQQTTVRARVLFVFLAFVNTKSLAPLQMGLIALGSAPTLNTKSINITIVKCCAMSHSVLIKVRRRKVYIDCHLLWVRCYGNKSNSLNHNGIDDKQHIYNRKYQLRAARSLNDYITVRLENKI